MSRKSGNSPAKERKYSPRLPAEKTGAHWSRPRYLSAGGQATAAAQNVKTVELSTSQSFIFS